MTRAARKEFRKLAEKMRNLVVELEELNQCVTFSVQEKIIYVDTSELLKLSLPEGYYIGSLNPEVCEELGYIDIRNHNFYTQLHKK